MPDLLDGQTADVWGSGSKPYQLKNVGGVFSCSCPAWRNQPLPIDQRTCKHLRQYRGEAAESARLGLRLTSPPVMTKSTVVAPPLLLAETWNPDANPTGWWLSEKLDGVRAWWNGKQFLSRNGHVYHAPAWFTQGLPATPLDGELWVGRKQFQRTVSIVRRGDASELWREVRYLIFDAPTQAQPFEQRLDFVTQLLATHQPPYALGLAQSVCRSAEHLRRELTRIEELGGEGLILRQPASLYEPRRSATLLKVKSFHDCEATVVDHEPGKGRHKGRLGALVVELANGTRCAVGTGFSDAQREHPPLPGTVITLKYQELTDAGVPRFPVFVGIRPDATPVRLPLLERSHPMSTTTAVKKRRFEFVQGTSSKFWEVHVQGSDVYVTYGRIGSTGQSSFKTLESVDAATSHAEKLVREKTGKRYVEVT